MEAVNEYLARKPIQECLFMILNSEKSGLVDESGRKFWQEHVDTCTRLMAANATVDEIPEILRMVHHGTLTGGTTAVNQATKIVADAGSISHKQFSAIIGTLDWLWAVSTGDMAPLRSALSGLRSATIAARRGPPLAEAAE
jgi:hypothetical protein